ncbi:MAG: DUF2992 family protein [Clostridiales bacterium]|jgi:hypothetical protein|nr:DUF2992 family protein [Eubacteriales bacterium]MDH7566011.1 DUF2992 family protein [Clostridiales bacterium]
MNIMLTVYFDDPFWVGVFERTADGMFPARVSEQHRDLYKVVSENGEIFAEVSGNLSKSFEDIEGLAAKCRYRDCSHTMEPGCAVRSAVEVGELPFILPFQSFQICKIGFT